MRIRIYIFNLKTNKKKQEGKKQKREKIISVENLTGCDDIVCEFAQWTFNLLIQSGISPDCLNEFNDFM